MTDLYLLASGAPGVLDDWTGPVEYHRGKNGRGDDVWEPGAVVNGWVCYAPAPPIRLPLARPEVRDRLVRWGMEHDRRECGDARYRWDLRRDSPSALLAEVKAVAEGRQA